MSVFCCDTWELSPSRDLMSCSSGCIFLSDRLWYRTCYSGDSSGFLEVQGCFPLPLNLCFLNLSWTFFGAGTLLFGELLLCLFDRCIIPDYSRSVLLSRSTSGCVVLINSLIPGCSTISTNFNLRCHLLWKCFHMNIFCFHFSWIQFPYLGQYRILYFRSLGLSSFCFLSISVLLLVIVHLCNFFIPPLY